MTSNLLKLKKMRFRIAVCFLVFLCNGICALQLSMVASRAPLGGQFDGSSASRKRNSLSQDAHRTGPASQDGVTSGLISQLAVMALKRRLKGQTYVACDVTATSSDILLRGQVGPVTVKGRGWQSALGLTCRAIEATVGSCQLDVGRVMSSQKLILTTPAEGKAMVALNSIDFGNFITHPLMRPPGLPEIEPDSGAYSSKLEFLKDGVSMDPASGTVTFFGTYVDAKWKFTLQRALNGQRALITATPFQTSRSDVDFEKIALGLTEVTSKFFNEMVFELDGTFLSFGDMMMTNKGKEPSVMLALSILVRKFPSPGLEF